MLILLRLLKIFLDIKGNLGYGFSIGVAPDPLAGEKFRGLLHQQPPRNFKARRISPANFPTQNITFTRTGKLCPKRVYGRSRK
jgi:hypothetical protein